MSGLPIADVSVEFAHVDVSDGFDEARVSTAIRREAVLLQPVLASLRGRGLSISTCVLIDDAGDGGAEHAQAVIRAAAAEHDLVVDYFVPQSVLTDSVRTIESNFYPEIPPGSEGILGTPKHVPTVDPVIADERWLENGEPGRDHPLPEPLRLPVRRLDGDKSGLRQTAGGRGTRMHAIHIDVELWSQERRRVFPGPTVWSFPLLAAWWQLLRLGAPTSIGGSPLDPAPDHDGAAPFVAYSTLTALPPEFVPVEHAVRTILGRVAIPDNWIAPARAGTVSNPLEHLERIGYLFAAELPVDP